MEELLKCDLCKNKFNLDNRRPLIAKCGHTYCRHCILSNKGEKNNNSCPACNVPFVLSIESCISNLKLEEIVKFVFHIQPQAPAKRKIIYIKPDLKRNKSPAMRTNYFSKENPTKPIRTNTTNKYATEFRFSHKDSDIFSNLNTKPINNQNFGSQKERDLENEEQSDEEKNNISETLETIPINDDNGINLSFKEDIKELLLSKKINIREEVEKRERNEKIITTSKKNTMNNSRNVVNINPTTQETQNEEEDISNFNHNHLNSNCNLDNAMIEHDHDHDHIERMRQPSMEEDLLTKSIGKTDLSKGPLSFLNSNTNESSINNHMMNTGGVFNVKVQNINLGPIQDLNKINIGEVKLNSKRGSNSTYHTPSKNSPTATPKGSSMVKPFIPNFNSNNCDYQNEAIKTSGSNGSDHKNNRSRPNNLTGNPSMIEHPVYRRHRFLLNKYSVK